MRIALVCPFDPSPRPSASRDGHVGGVERVFAEVSRTLARRGNDVTMICSTDGAAGRSVQQDVTLVRRRRSFTVLRAPATRLARAIPEGADLVHVPATYPFTTVPTLRRAAALRVPSVLDFHFEPAPASAVGRVAARLYALTGPRSYALADAVLLRSYAYGNAARSLANVPRDRWRIVPNGIDTRRFRPDGPGGTGDYLLFVGRLVPYKGLPVLLRALALRPPGLPLVVAGDGPLRDGLEVRARRLGVDARFVGYVPDDELPTLYRGARLTILPSVNRQEAFGMALLESMACGTPVVASRLPGVEELARWGGRVAQPGDAADLAERIHEALAPGAELRGDELARRIHASFSWDAVTDRLVSVYREVLERRRPPAASPEGAEVTTFADPGRRPVL